MGSHLMFITSNYFSWLGFATANISSSSSQIDCFLGLSDTGLPLFGLFLKTFIPKDPKVGPSSEAAANLFLYLPEIEWSFLDFASCSASLCE